MIDSAFEKAYNLLRSKGLPFCIFAPPESDELSIVLQFDNKVNLASEERSKDSSGIFYSPFDPSESAKIIIGDFVGRISEFPWEEVRELNKAPLPDSFPAFNPDMEKAEYLDAVNGVISEIQSSLLEKVVYARTKSIAIDISPISIFLKAVREEKSAFTYLMSTHSGAIWMGATPELLLESKGDRFHTVSIAGTAKIGNEAELSTNKNREEQEIVTRYITEILRKAGAEEIVVSAPYIVNASNICHNKTEISFTNNSPIPNSFLHFVNELHPTPAVAGKPLNMALQSIKSAETCSRELYAGPIGVLNIAAVNAVYVNIRCVQLRKDQLKLYAGGGITKDSDAETEWIETENKMQLWLSKVNKTA